MGYPATDDPDFQNKIYKKREFYYYKLQNRPELSSYKEIEDYRNNKIANKTKAQILLANILKKLKEYDSVLSMKLKFFDFIFQKLQQQSEEENKMAQTAIRLEKEKVEAVKKAEAEKTAAIKSEEEKRKKRVSKVQEIEDLKIQLANSGLEQLQGAELLKNLQNNVKISQKDFDKISQKVASGADGYTQDDLNNAEADLVRAQVELANETKKQELDAKKPQTESARETVKLTVSSLREIGGSFGGGDVNNVMDRQIELLQTQIDALNKIASNTEPKSDVGVSKPIGDTNFTVSTE
jgi:hypothetical protein